MFRRLYGEHVLHLIVLLGALALGAYTISVLGVGQLFNPRVWWQSIAVWFAVAVIGHDLILFPLYALAERFLPKGRSAVEPANQHRVGSLPPLTNYLRMPTLATALTFALFFPGIIRQGAFTRHRRDRPDPGAVPGAVAAAGGGLLPDQCRLLRGAQHHDQDSSSSPSDAMRALFAE